jgi:ABC-2 type transport system permease protein
MSQPVDSVIHDLGYQRYAGARLGRWYATRSLYEHSLRAAFGLGRGAKAKLFPWTVAGLVGLVAVVITAIQSQSTERVLTYPRFSDAVGLLSVLFVAAVAPELVSRDLGAGVLPLYFSRPLRRVDYALAKLAAMVTAVLLLLGVPQLLIFMGGAFSTDDGALGAWREAVLLGTGLLHAAVHAMVIGSLGLLAASLTRRRAFAAAAVVAVFLVPTPVTGVLSQIGGETASQLAPLTNPLGMLSGLGMWLFDRHNSGVGNFGPLYALTAVALVGVCTTGLLVRYRRAKA